MKKISFAIILLAACLQTYAQHLYTLKECQEHALQNNVKIKAANTDIRMAQETRSIARSHYIPTVSASLSAFDASKDLINIEMPTLPMIGSLGTMGMVNDGQVGGVTAMLPLYAGGKIHNSNKLAELGIEVSRLQLSQNESEVRMTTALYYWQIVMLKEKLKTLDVIEAQVAEIHRTVDAAVNAGITLRNDLLQVNLKQNELSSSRLKVNDGLQISRMLLAQYAGMGLDSIDVESTIDFSMPPAPSTVYQAPSQALPQTAEYQLLQQNVKAQQLQQKITFGNNLPTLAIGGGYSYMNLMDKSQNFWLGFATISVPISSWLGGTHEVRRQKGAVEKAQLALNDNSELLQLQMVNKWNKLNESYSQLSIALNSIKQAEENLRLQTNQYQAGVCTMSDLLEAQTLYQKSRDLYTDAYTTYQMSTAEYLKATGR